MGNLGCHIHIFLFEKYVQPNPRLKPLDQIGPDIEFTGNTGWVQK